MIHIITQFDHESLTKRAKSENRSIAQQTIFILKNSLGSSDAIVFLLDFCKQMFAF